MVEASAPCSHSQGWLDCYAERLGAFVRDSSPSETQLGALPATDQVHRPRASNVPLLLPHTYEEAGEGDEVQIPGSPSPSSMGQRYTDRWARMPAIECSWAVARESVGHVPVPASGALAPIRVALAMATVDLGGTLQLAARAERRQR